MHARTQTDAENPHLHSTHVIIIDVLSTPTSTLRSAHRPYGVNKSDVIDRLTLNGLTRPKIPGDTSEGFTGLACGIVYYYSLVMAVDWVNGAD